MGGGLGGGNLPWPLLNIGTGNYHYRKPTPSEAKGCALVLGLLSLLIFGAGCYPELRKNFVWLPAKLGRQPSLGIRCTHLVKTANALKRARQERRHDESRSTEARGKARFG